MRCCIAHFDLKKQAATISILVFTSSILKDRAIELLNIVVNRVVNDEEIFPVIAERLMLQFIVHSNKYSVQNFKNPDYCGILKCLDVIISTASEQKAVEEDSEVWILGQVVMLCNQGDPVCALAESSKLNLATTSNEEVFTTLAHHVCIALLIDGNVDTALDYFSKTVLQMSLRRTWIHIQKQCLFFLDFNRVGSSGTNVQFHGFRSVEE